MAPTRQDVQTVVKLAQAETQAEANSQPPHSTVPLYFRPPTVARAMLLAALVVIVHSWQAQGQLQGNSLASLANHIWQPEIDLQQQQQQQQQVNTDSQIDSIEQSVNQNAIGPGTQQQQAYPILEQQFETRKC